MEELNKDRWGRGQFYGVKEAKTQVQNGDLMVTTLRKRVMTSGGKIGRSGSCFTDIVRR